MEKSSKIPSFYNIFWIFTRWITTFPNFSQKTSLNFYENRNINWKLTFKMHAKAENKTADSFFWDGVCSTTAWFLKASLRPSNDVFVWPNFQ